MNTRRILIARPHGFCAGVWRALDIVAAALRTHPPPLYCLHEIVHNRQVVEDLAARGVRVVDRIDEIPAGAPVVFSAHGVTPETRAAAERRGLRAIDATCPFVDKIHRAVRRYAREGFTVLLIGDRRHDEVIGVAGEAPDHVVVVGKTDDVAGVRVADPTRVAVATQTTLSIDEAAPVLAAVRARFPGAVVPPKGDICYATTNRQEAVRRIAAESDVVLVLGSASSSNSNRLVEVARRAGVRGELAATLADVERVDLEGVRTVGLTSGASTPEAFLDAAVAALRARGFEQVDERTVAEERVAFAVPQT